MTQIEKGKTVMVRKDSPVLRGAAATVEKLAAPVTGTVAQPPLTRFLGMVEVTLSTGKKKMVGDRKVIRPGQVTAQGAALTVLPTAEVLVG